MTDTPQNAPLSPGEILAANHREFLGIMDRATEAFSSGAPEEAARLLQAAANLAWKRKTGLFSCAALESLLGRIAQDAGICDEDCPENDAPGEKKRRVLHVFTETYAIGGHTRLAQRWMILDSASRHDAVSTQQGSRPPPDSLLAAVRRSGGNCHTIDTPGSSFLERAHALRRISRGADFIVVHQHPHDVIPALAYSVDNHTPVIYMNHADHSFWTGASIANTIAHFRESGIELSRHRRGIDNQRIQVLPIPIDRVKDSPGRTEAKKVLGLTTDSFLIVSIGADWKYRTFDHFDYLEMVEPFLHEYKDAFVLAVGVSEQDKWAAASQRTGGRIQTPGTIRNLDMVYRAADVLLSPIPLGSVTSMLEGASYGLPLVSFCPQGTPARVLFNDDINIPDHLHQVADAAGLRARLASLKQDETARKQLGDTMRELCERAHIGDNWLQYMNKIYTAAETTPAKPPSADAAMPRITGLDMMLLHCSG
ncbi:MAG TPA: hypothetical protein ENK49_00040 [Gammaproteobacteria bacterium]|nr:hypothetical protein [Gammaproteobacteria bacterium]